MLPRLLPSGALILLCGGHLSAQTGTSAARHVTPSLVAEKDALPPGRSLLVGVRLKMEPGWHTYWRNPGDSGLPTRIAWRLPSGFTAGEIQWPHPERFTSGPLASYGYAGEVLLPVEIRVPDGLAPGSPVRLAARVDWLECLEVCLPGKAELEMTLPVRASAGPGKAAPLFAAARDRLPRADPAWAFSASAGPGAFVLGVRPPRGVPVREAYFYPIAGRLLEHGQPQTLSRAGTRLDLSLPRDPNGPATVERLTGVLVARTETGTVARAVDVPLNKEKKR